MFTEQDAEIALKQLEKLKGKERAQLIERMMRCETRHFKSKQYRLTGTAGLEDGAWGKYFPKGYKTIKMLDNQPDKVKNPVRTFIVMDDVLEFCLFLSDYIDRHLGNYARWNSLSEERQKAYRKSVDSIKNRFIV